MRASRGSGFGTTSCGGSRSRARSSGSHTWSPGRFTHDFRRMFATEMVTGGLPIHIAAKVLGHSRLTTTQGYTAVSNEDLIRS